MTTTTVDEPVLSFNQAALKIQWSQILIQNLDRVCAYFIQSKPYHVSVERDAQEGRYRFDVGLKQDIPPQISLLMGDICGNLRAALDYAWMGLVRRESSKDADKKTLPFANDRQALKGMVTSSAIKRAAKEAEGLLVDRIKPHYDFTNGGNVPLAALNKLSNWNKHNLLIAAAGVTQIRSVDLGRGNRIERLNVYGGVCTPVGFASPDGKLTYEGEPAVEILFGKHDLVEHDSVVPTLVNLSEAAAEALQAFCEVFPDPRNPTFSH
jgi:hypothetical protein